MGREEAEGTDLAAWDGPDASSVKLKDLRGISRIWQPSGQEPQPHCTDVCPLADKKVAMSLHLCWARRPLAYKTVIINCAVGSHRVCSVQLWGTLESKHAAQNNFPCSFQRRPRASRGKPASQSFHAQTWILAKSCCHFLRTMVCLCAWEANGKSTLQTAPSLPYRLLQVVWNDPAVLCPALSPQAPGWLLGLCSFM